MIIVSSMWKLDMALTQFKAQHVISINDPGSNPPALPSIKQKNRINLQFHDVIENTQSVTPVSAAQIEEIVSFGKTVIDGGSPVLIHCTAGVSRSTAAGLVLAASFEVMEIAVIVKLLREKAPYSQPNSLIVQLGDNYLELDGQLVSAVGSLKEPNSAMVPEPFVLNVV
jgi:predicted protein tyrosine phosphatase